LASATTSNSQPNSTHRTAVRAALLMLALSAGAVAHEDDGAGVHMTKQEALEEVAFPDADRVERRTLFLEPDEQQALSRRARSQIDSRLQTVYVGYRDDKITGYAVIDTGTVRTKAATYIAVMEPHGRLRDLRILAWQEPPEYQPPQRWLDRLLGRKLDDGSLQAGRDVDAISGATLSVRMLTEHVRRALALHDVLLEDPSVVQR
jgi:Na+-translocating ferredoxin:NAD+ oxidoreductase RnfG subunit